MHRKRSVIPAITLRFLCVKMGQLKIFIKFSFKGNNCEFLLIVVIGAIDDNKNFHKHAETSKTILFPIGLDY